MKRISRQRSAYRMVNDQRREPVRLGKYIYLTVIGIIILTIVHLALGRYYLLEGEGFLSSYSETVALEFDATIKELRVGEGDVVDAKAPLLRYDSVWLRTTIANLSARIAELRNKLSDSVIQRARLDATLMTARKYADFTQDLETTLRDLRKKGLVPNSRLSVEVLRRFEAERDLLAYRAERKKLDEAIRTLEENLARTQNSYDRLLAGYDNGNISAPTQGIVANVAVTKGTVVTKGQPVLQIFSGERHIVAYLDDRSPISVNPGDPILVSISGGPISVGYVASVAKFADRLPAEFQSRFRPTGRKRSVVIRMDQDRLTALPLMSTVKLYKPIGLAMALPLIRDLRARIPVMVKRVEAALSDFVTRVGRYMA